MARRKRDAAVRRQSAGLPETPPPLPVPSAGLIRAPGAAIPQAEMTLLTATGADALTLGREGRHAYGYLLLLKGITHANRRRDRGEAWGTALAALYSQELHRYCERFPDAS